MMAVAKEAAKIAGNIHQKYFQTNYKIETKSTSYDRVTIADTESETAIVSKIKEHFPDHDILGEEEDYQRTDSRFLWIIDPLDGTNNFSSGFPFYCVSIALYMDNEPFIGVVFDSGRNEWFTAQKGEGAYLNDQKIQVSDVHSLNNALLITGFYYDRGEIMKRTLNQIQRFFEKDIIGMRRTGSAALDICYVAAGRATGYWELTLSPWDFAAARLILEEAGGTLTSAEGHSIATEKSSILASNGKIHPMMLEILNDSSSIA